MHDPTHDQDPVAMRLAVAMKRLRARLREAAPVSATGLPIAQLAILQRLRVDGPATASALAAAEYVSEQAIAQNLAMLKRTGLVHVTLDPNDGRKRVISVTAAGHHLFEAVLASRNAWLVQAIDATISADERPALYKAIELLERLADADC